MTREEHKAIIQQMLSFVSADNQANASQLLTQLSDDYEETLTANETLTTTNAELTTKNERLREVNSELFMKVGTTKKENQNPPNNQDNGGQGSNNEDPELKFEDLFNEKGELL